MKHVRWIALLAIGLSLPGCAWFEGASVTRAENSKPIETKMPVVESVLPTMSIARFDVRVPETLKVSEANTYYPKGDIVWHEDPLGDRHAQVKAIFDESLARSKEAVKGELPVIVNIEVKRFHALTPKTRYTIGGRHEILFVMNLYNAKTGMPVGEPREVNATFKGFGGEEAILAERSGITQRVRITDKLISVMKQQLAGEA